MNPANTLHYIYVVFMLRGYAKIMLELMLGCLVFTSRISGRGKMEKSTLKATVFFLDDFKCHV